jgi:uncharacterized protein involved in exopolysaccharide biosynthesis
LQGGSVPGTGGIVNESENASSQGLHEALKGPPSGYFVVVPEREEDGAARLAALAWLTLRSWKLLCATAFVGAIVAAVISLQMREIFRAQVLVAPVTQSNAGIGGRLNDQFGGLAALAGVDLTGVGTRKEEAYATLASAGLAREFIQTEKLLPVLFADRWDAAAGRWRPGKEPPTLETGVKRFVTRVRFVEEDRRTGLVTLAIEWTSPQVAAEWANRMVEMTNDRLRIDSTHTAERSIEFLNKELVKTNVVELREAIYRLIETQVNNAMLANVQREFAFRFIDRAVPPELRISPKRTLLTLLGGAIGFLLGLAWVVGRGLLRGIR